MSRFRKLSQTIWHCQYYIGLSAFIRYAYGNTSDSDAAATPAQDELDLNLRLPFQETNIERSLAAFTRCLSR